MTDLLQKNIISKEYLQGCAHRLTQATDELPKIDEGISVLVKETEEAQSQGVRVGPVGPGEQQLEEAFELLQVDAVLLQVGQAGVMTLCGVAAAAPVTAGQVLRLKYGRGRGENSHV